jgi:hypothetical protein
MHNFTNYDPFLAAKSAGVEKTFVSGIQASSDPIKLIETMERLGLIERALAKSCKGIAAASSGAEVTEFVKVSVYAVDQALKRTTADTESRIAYKRSLERMGWLGDAH